MNQSFKFWSKSKSWSGHYSWSCSYSWPKSYSCSWPGSRYMSRYRSMFGLRSWSESGS